MLRSFHCLLALLLISSAAAENRVFVSLAGTLLEAEITSVTGDSVTLKRSSDGQPLTINKNTLCKEDNAYITAWAEKLNAPPIPAVPAPPAANTSAINDPAASSQKFSLSVQTLPSKSNQAAPSSTERIFETKYTFNISNKEVKRDLEGAKAIVVTFGRSAAEGAGDLIVLQKAQFDLSIRAQSKTTLTTTPVQLIYSAEFRYGVRSHGYVLVILDAAGNPLFTEATPDVIAKFWKEAITLPGEPPLMVDRAMKPRPGIEGISSYIRF